MPSPSAVDRYDQIGGSACYCSIMARQFKFDVDLHTRFGADFPSQYLAENGIDPTGCESGSGTTRFAIAVDGSDRTLVLEHQCEPVPYAKADADGHMVSPIFQEISGDVLESIKGDSRFLLVDPQGFSKAGRIRKNRIVLERTNLDLSGVDAVKVSPGEAKCLADGTGTEMMKVIQKMGVKYVLLTDKTKRLASGRRQGVLHHHTKQADSRYHGDRRHLWCGVLLHHAQGERLFVGTLLCRRRGPRQRSTRRTSDCKRSPAGGRCRQNASYFYNTVKVSGICNEFLTGFFCGVFLFFDAARRR